MILENVTKITDSNCVGMLQVHGSKIAIVSAKDGGHTISSCDGLVTNDPDIFLKISVADCIPLALFDPVKNCIGLVHAGWRGLDEKIIANAINAMVGSFGTNPGDILSEIGPHICQSHYEIKSDLAEKFSDFPGSIKKLDGKIFLDLADVAKSQLINCGVLPGNIKINKRCTFEDTSLPSYRRGDYKNRIHYFLKVPESP